MEENNSFKPYVSADKVLPEFTPSSIIIGVLLAIVFGAANAYLGLRVGMTVSASIPAAVIGMGVYKLIGRFSTKKDDTILESNMVQTIGSAGESLAAGAIFTMPALFLWAAEGKAQMPGIVEIALIAMIGGLLGICFMVPLRKALIVKEHGTLPYPEGTACAEVLLAGQEGGANAAVVFIGMGVSALIKFIVDGFKVVSNVATLTINKIHGEISTEVYPALISVGYICGFKIASYMFAGCHSWLAGVDPGDLFVWRTYGTVPCNSFYRRSMENKRSVWNLVELYPLYRRRCRCSRWNYQLDQIIAIDLPYLCRCDERYLQ